MRIFILRINIPKTHNAGQRGLRVALPAPSGFEELPPLIFVHLDVFSELGLLVIGRGDRPLVFKTAHMFVAWPSLDFVLCGYPLEADTVKVYQAFWGRASGHRRIMPGPTWGARRVALR